MLSRTIHTGVLALCLLAGHVIGDDSGTTTTLPNSTPPTDMAPPAGAGAGSLPSGLSLPQGLLPPTPGGVPPSSMSTFISPSLNPPKSALSENAKISISISVTLSAIILVGSMSILCVVRARTREAAKYHQRLLHANASGPNGEGLGEEAGKASSEENMYNTNYPISPATLHSAHFQPQDGVSFAPQQDVGIGVAGLPAPPDLAYGMGRNPVISYQSTMSNGTNYSPSGGVTSFYGTAANPQNGYAGYAQYQQAGDVQQQQQQQQQYLSAMHLQPQAYLQQPVVQTQEQQLQAQYQLQVQQQQQQYQQQQQQQQQFLISQQLQQQQQQQQQYEQQQRQQYEQQQQFQAQQQFQPQQVQNQPQPQYQQQFQQEYQQQQLQPQQQLEPQRQLQPSPQFQAPSPYASPAPAPSPQFQAPAPSPAQIPSPCPSPALTHSQIPQTPPPQQEDPGKWLYAVSESEASPSGTTTTTTATIDTALASPPLDMHFTYLADYAPPATTSSPSPSLGGYSVATFPYSEDGHGGGTGTVPAARHIAELLGDGHYREAP